MPGGLRWLLFSLVAGFDAWLVVPPTKFQFVPPGVVAAALALGWALDSAISERLARQVPAAFSAGDDDGT